MNFDAIMKMSTTKDLLTDKPEAKGTKQYLLMVNKIIEAFLSKDTSILQRIYNMWYCAFFLRSWRHWLKFKKFSTEDNCVTLNTYTCIELNAHGIVLMLEKCRQNNDIDSFLPWLLSSQVCEKTFRQLRSMT